MSDLVTYIKQILLGHYRTSSNAIGTPTMSICQSHKRLRGIVLLRKILIKIHVKIKLGDAHMRPNLVIIGSGNGLSPVRRQAITWTNDDLLSIAPFGKKLRSWKEKPFEHVVCKLLIISFRPRWVINASTQRETKFCHYDFCLRWNGIVSASDIFSRLFGALSELILINS